MSIPLEHNGLYEFGPFSLDPGDYRLTSDGVPVAITPKAHAVLLVLLRNGNRLTTKEELMRTVWPDSFVEDANLTVTVSSLRRALGEAPGGAQYIETVPKKGYRFSVPVRVVPAASPALADPAPDRLQRAAAEPANGGGLDAPLADAVGATDPAGQDAPAASPRMRVGRWSPLLAAGTALAAVVLGLTTLLPHREGTGEAAARAPRRLAILPFQNPQATADTSFLGYSLADAIITRLGYVEALTVKPSSAVQKYANREVDIARVAHELDVDTLLTGTVLRDGDDLRITCQLVDVGSETILWKDAFDLKYDKLLTVQDRVSREVIQGLELTLSPSELEDLKPEEAIAPVAYEYFLRGVDLYARGEFALAIRMFERSTELAPDYAPAWANLGRAHTANASFQLGGGGEYRKAEAAFTRALGLRPDAIDTRTYMANLLTDTGRVEEAVPLLRGAVATNPSHAEVHWELGYAYRFGGMLPESIAECVRARQLDPGVKSTSSALNAYLYVGDYDRFLESLPASEDAPLILFYRGFAEYHLRNWTAAQAYFARAYALDATMLQARIGRALGLGLSGKAADGLALLHEVETTVAERGVGDPEALYKIAEAYAVLGEPGAALRVLGRSIEGGFFAAPYFERDPLLESLRGQSGWQPLLAAARRRHEAFRARFF